MKSKPKTQVGSVAHQDDSSNDRPKSIDDLRTLLQSFDPDSLWILAGLLKRLCLLPHQEHEGIVAMIHALVDDYSNRRKK